MPTNSDVLARLRQHFDPEALSETVGRLLRLPEIWAALADPEVLEDEIGRAGEKQLDLGEIVLHAVPGPTSGPDISALPAEVQTELERVISGDLGDPPHAGADLKALGIRTLALIQLEGKAGGADGICDRVRSDPAVWRTPLACAWPHLTDSKAVLAGVLAPCDLPAVQAATVCLLSHSSLEDAATELMDAFPAPVYRLLAHLHDLGEDRLAETISRQMLSSDDPARSHRHDPLEALIDQAAAQERVNGPSAAQNLLDAAWERAGQVRADIADRLADVAEGAGESAVAAEALRRALAEVPNPDRKARAALALIESNQVDEGLNLLPGSPESPTELIAVGLAYARDERQAEATRYLTSAAASIADGRDLHPRWLARLARALLDSGCPVEAAQVASRWAESSPGSLAARVALAEALHSAGDDDGAIHNAELLLVKDDSQDYVRQILAESLQSQGEPEIALEHWQRLALSNARALKQVVECALDAGHIELARDQAARWLALDPDSPQALVNYGRALTASGDIDSAIQQLTRAAERTPQSPETWLALAEAQRAGGNDEEADQTLGRAIQICPDQPSLLTAQGHALANQERYSEALDHFEKALRLSEDDPEIQLGFGQLLTKLGHIDRAVPVLEKALARRSAHTPTRVALAEAYEQIGDVAGAHELVQNIPDGASDYAQKLAGRLAIKAAATSGDQRDAERGLHRLQLASSGTASDPETLFWIAEGLRMTGQSEEAMLAYQSCLGAGSAVKGDKQLKVTHGLAQAAMDSGQTPVAISVLENLRQSTGGSPESLRLLSKAYRKAGLADEALAPALEAIERDPESQEARSEAVAAAMEAEAWGAALVQIDRWAELSPRDPEVWIQKAKLHAQLSQIDESRTALARALFINRAQPASFLPISQLLTRLGKPTQAVRILKRASAAEPSNENILKALADTAERTEDHESALGAWHLIADRSPDDQTALRHVGENLWRLNRRSEAIGYWQRGLAQDPSNVGLSLRVAQAHLDNGEPERGLDHLRQALALRPDDPQLALQAANAVRRHASANEALEILQQALALVPGDINLQLAMTDIFSEMGSYEDARQVLVQLLDSESAPSPSVLARLSIIELDLGNVTASSEAFARIGSDDFESADVALWVARAAFGQAAWPQSATAIRAAIDQAEDNPEVLVAAVELQARLADAAWLYGEAASVRGHSPRVESPSPETAQLWIEKARRMGIAEDICQRLDQHLALVAARIQPEAVEAEEASPGLIESLAIAKLRCGQPDKVISILADNPHVRESEWAPFLAGLAHLQSGRFVQARKAFGASLPRPSLKPLAAYFTALALQQQNQVAEAIDALNIALAAWPDEAAWHHTLAQSYVDIGEMDLALPHYQQAVELEPEDRSYGLSLARHLQSLGVHHQAEEHFAHALEAFPLDADVWRQAGFASLAIGDNDEALVRFRRASELAPEDPGSRVGAARAAQAGGQLATALQWASQAVDLAPDNSEALMGWADILAAQGKHDKALSAYQRAEASMADPSVAQRARSTLFLHTGRPEAAVLDLKKVIVSRPEDETAWSSLAEAYERSGELDQAVEAVRKALTISPGDAPHRLTMARLSRKTGQLDHALAELSTLQVEQPDDADVAYEIGRVHEARRDLAKAMDEYRRAIVLDQDHAGAHFHAGLVLKALKNYDQAAAMFKCAVDLSPNDADAHHQLAAVRALELVHGGIQQTSAVAP
jgi:tetratricopeptide (TPR) repeat protein